MGVEERQVALAQGDQVAVGAEIGLDRLDSRPSRLTVKLAGLVPPAAGEPESSDDLVAVADVGRRRRDPAAAPGRTARRRRSAASVNDSPPVAKSAKTR